jgi:hypothetical protein
MPAALRQDSAYWFSFRRLNFWGERCKRAVMVIGRVFLDESISRDPYICGGWIAENGAWDVISEEWNRVLKSGKPAAYFKLSDALRLKGAFDGWTDIQRDEKINELALILPHDDRLLQGLACHIHKRDFDDIDKRYLKRVYKVPYFFGLSVLMLKAVDWFTPFEKIDFVLDRDDCKQAERMRRLFYSRIKPLNDRFGECHTLCDKETPGLQAADMLAGFMRQSHEESFLPIQAKAHLNGIITREINLDIADLISLVPSEPFVSSRFAG